MRYIYLDSLPESDLALVLIGVCRDQSLSPSPFFPPPFPLLCHGDLIPFNKRKNNTLAKFDSETGKKPTLVVSIQTTVAPATGIGARATLPVFLDKLDQTPPAKIFEFGFQCHGFPSGILLDKPQQTPGHTRSRSVFYTCIVAFKPIKQILGLALVKGARVLGIEDVDEVWFYLGRV